MKNNHDSKKLLASLLAVLIFFVSGHALAANGGQEEPVPVKISIILSDPLVAKESDPLPPDIGDMALPIADPKKICEGLIIMPKVQLVRADLTDKTEKPLLPEDKEQNSGALGIIADLFGKKPSREKLGEYRREALQSVRAGKELTQPGQKTVTLEELANDRTVKDASLRFVLPDKPDEAREDEIKKAFSAGSEPIVVKDKNILRQHLLENLCTGDLAQVKQNSSDKTFTVIYKPHLPVEQNESNQSETDKEKTKCNPDILSRGMQFVSLAKNANHPKARTQDLENALHLFDQAVAEAAAAGQCSCAKASMNRGVVRGLLNQPKKALEDLQEAERCDPQNAEVLYNLAGHYSVYKNQLDPPLELAFDALDKALAAGFKDCRLLLEDRDLANLRAKRNLFRDTLQKHGLFCR